ncbi:GerAB/ArcD/ProY family transporter [Aquibacillus kalidii]|uniref:GerAB/ArcD/ProY family transporter n=1 Tax=Aquibacillus kalidii TaxID=2762597 RepID=UPI00164792A4|nr:endospore germination permease [Aquibacillus kalidii]
MEGFPITSYKINTTQLFVLIFLFEVGSSIVVGIGFDAKQDAWLAILLALIGGILLFTVYALLFYQFPNYVLTEYVELVFGKLIGKLVALVYVMYFLYIAARVLRDFGDLLITTTLSQTPLLVINLIIVLLVMYSCHLGIEVIARAGNIFFIIWIMLAFLFFLFVFVAQLPKVENLQPVLENGWMPVVKAAFPTTLTFPFGELIVFTMIFPFLNRKQALFKTGLIALLFSGLLLTVTMTVILSILGPTLSSSTQFPFLEAISKVSIADIIQRLDPIALVILIIGIYFKIVIFYFCSVYGFEKIWRLKENRRKYLLLISGVSILTLSIVMAEGLTEHLQIGIRIVPLYLHLPLQVFVPILILLIHLVKRTVSKTIQK